MHRIQNDWYVLAEKIMAKKGDLEATRNELREAFLSLAPLLNMLQSMINLNNLFNQLGIGELIDKINSMLGCLSFSDCNVTGDIISSYDRFTGTFKGFTGSGFDITEIGIGTPFESISGDIKTLGKKVENTIKGAAVVVPTRYF
jgi:hypothetical protein